MSLQKGIVEEITDKYSIKVRVPKYDKLATDPYGVKTRDLADAIMCTLPGMSIAYSVGDIVLVDFENDELNNPVVLGLLYRDTTTDAVLKLEETDKKIDAINEQLDKLSSNGMYTHIKYSNDGGKTFTSLFEYMELGTVEKNLEVYFCERNIAIDDLSSTVTWSVIDNNNNELADSLTIKTILSTTELESFDDVLKTSEELAETIDTSTSSVSDDYVVLEGRTNQIPANFNGQDHLYLSFLILKTIDLSDKDTYHTVLATDKNELGTTYGDYMGICIDSNVDAPLDPSSYSWSSIVDRNKQIVNDLDDELRPRVEANEEALYGYNKTTGSEISTSGLGILNAISIATDSIILGTNKKNVYMGSSMKTYFDTNTDTLVEDKIQSGHFIRYITKSGSLRLIYRSDE